MNTNFDYYYNFVEGKGYCRNNLIYTSLISKDKKTFCQWYYNDPNYHQGKNKVVDPSLMEEKWQREVKFLTHMHKTKPDIIPEILDIDYINKKIYLKIDGVDFWQQSDPVKQGYDNVLVDWKEQMLEIIQTHRDLQIYKMSMHPSSYFIINGKLKSINYFFCYDFFERALKLEDVFSHISYDRLEKLYPLMNKLNIDHKKEEPLQKIQLLAFETFKSNFPNEIMEKSKKIYTDT
jgi:hypothetical protein